jgi:hypothetical protein
MPESTVEVLAVRKYADQGITDSLGLDMLHEVAGDWIEFTVRAKS